ncbi:ATP-binding protein [Streptomyces sp. NPDC002580]|uniref:ATP-binding protein n=1 Tax=Streptomyces sp. NPDC002580 TaxID=3364653 RepID=UPI0036BAA008
MSATVDGEPPDAERPVTGPMVATIDLGGGGHRIADARQFAAAFLDQARTESLVAVSTRTVEIAQLVVSELVTNARVHAPGPASLRLEISAATLEIAVWDSDPSLPAAEAADPARIGRHGLEIVTAVAQKVDIRREPVGKRVTAHIALADLPNPSMCTA